jgi:DNA-binding response OmpR family regulator
MVRVLVATSDHTQRQAMAVALCGAGMETVWAGSGRDAIAEVASGHNGIDAVIVDPGLVDLGIDEVTAVIRAIDRDLAVIVWREPAAAVVNEVVALLEPDLDPSGHS